MADGPSQPFGGPSGNPFGERAQMVRAPLWLKAVAVVGVLAGVGLLAVAAAAGLAVLLLLIPVLLALWVVRAIINVIRTDEVPMRGGAGDSSGRDNVRVIDRN